MKRINLLKYGFERSIKDDFDDDGNKFTCYRHPLAPNIRVSKLIIDGDVYLSSSIKELDIMYEEYKECPHYEEANWKYNGISIATLIDEDLQAFTNAVIEYQKEAEEALKNAYIPTRKELELKYNIEYNEAKADKEKALELFELLKQAIFDPSIDLELHHSTTNNEMYLKYSIKDFKKNINEIEKILRRNKEQFIEEMLAKPRTQQIRYIQSRPRSDYYYKECKEYLEKIIKA